MSLATATLIPGLLLFALGTLLLIGGASAGGFLKALPRSTAAAVVFFGGAAAWFLVNLAHISKADLIVFDNPRPLVIGFGVLALLSFKFAPDFLAVRGLAALVLLGASPLLAAGFMNFAHWQINFYKIAVYVAIALAIWLGAQPWRLRDFLNWLFARPTRPQALGGLLAGYGLLLVVVAFTY
jgi:hypothetical protein